MEYDLDLTTQLFEIDDRHTWNQENIKEGDFYFDDVFSEVEDQQDCEEMILGPSYISYGGEPPMDVECFNLWLGAIGVKGKVTKLLFNGMSNLDYSLTLVNKEIS